MAAVGRPTILTPELTEAICGYIRKGVPKNYACYLVGITEQCLFQWIEKGSSDEANEVYRVFVDSLKRAEAEFVLNVRDEVAKAGPGWQAHMTLGERLQPSVFGRMDRAQIEIRDGRAGGVIIPEPR